MTTIIGAVQGEFSSSGDPILLNCLAELHLKAGQPAKALPYLIRLRRTETFDIIRQYNLFNIIQDQALSLVEFDEQRAVTLLVDHVHSIPVRTWTYPC
jgi:hypothetical protein